MAKLCQECCDSSAQSKARVCGRANAQAPWYVVQVLAGTEERVCALIHRAFRPGEIIEECFVPRYEIQKRFRGQWQRRSEVLFPGYLIVITRNIDALHRALSRIPQFARLLGTKQQDGSVAFVPLDDEDKDWIAVFTERGRRAVGISEAVMEGDKVRVLRGPLMGHEAWIKSVNRHKRTAYLEMRMFGRTITTKVGLGILRRE